MKLAVVVHDYLPLHLGGTEIHAHQMAREMARRGHQLRVLCTERDLCLCEGDWRVRELDGIEVHELIHQREYADVHECYEQRLAGESLRAHLLHWRPDAVHFQHLAFWGANAIHAAKEAGARAIVTLHDYHLLCDRGTLLKRDESLCQRPAAEHCGDCLLRHPFRGAPGSAPLAGQALELALRSVADERRALHRRALAAADALIAPSQFLARIFADNGLAEFERLQVLHSGYPGPRRAARASDPTRALRVGYVGGIYPSKGVHVLLEAVARAKSAQPSLGLELSVHGILDWFPDYVLQLRALASGAPVAFRGSFEPAQLDQILAELDLLVVPSLWYENMPLTIQEAFRNGLPVLASDLGGMREALQSGRGGRLFPAGDAAALARLLTGLAHDRDELFRLASSAPEPPTVAAIGDRLEALYRGPALAPQRATS